MRHLRSARGPSPQGRPRPLVMAGLLLGMSVGLLLGRPAVAAVYVVAPDGSGDSPTIALAVSAAVDGDVIELTDGVFRGDGNRDVYFQGKSITIHSQSGDPATCVIDCEGAPDVERRGFLFVDHEDSGAVLRGITITNGSAPG